MADSRRNNYSGNTARQRRKDQRTQGAQPVQSRTKVNTADTRGRSGQTQRGGGSAAPRSVPFSGTVKPSAVVRQNPIPQATGGVNMVPGGTANNVARAAAQAVQNQQARRENAFRTLDTLGGRLADAEAGSRNASRYANMYDAAFNRLAGTYAPSRADIAALGGDKDALGMISQAKAGYAMTDRIYGGALADARNSIAEAQKYRDEVDDYRKRGLIGKSDYDTYMQDINAYLELADSDYANLLAERQAGRDRYHQSAELARASSGGYSGGAAGDEYRPYEMPRLNVEDYLALNREGEDELKRIRLMQSLTESGAFPALEGNPQTSPEYWQERYDALRANEGGQYSGYYGDAWNTLAGAAHSIEGGFRSFAETDAQRSRNMQANSGNAAWREAESEAEMWRQRWLDGEQGAYKKYLEAHERALSLGDYTPVDLSLPGQQLNLQSQAEWAAAKEGKSKPAQIVLSALQSTIQQIPYLAIGAATGNPALGAAISSGLMSAQAAGNYMTNATAAGMNAQDAFAEGMLMGGVEFATEYMGAETMLKGLLGTSGMTFRKYLLQTAAAEGIEEMVADPLDYGVQMYYHDPNADFSLLGMMESGLTGALAGVMLGGTGAGIRTAVNGGFRNAGLDESMQDEIDAAWEQYRDFTQSREEKQAELLRIFMESGMDQADAEDLADYYDSLYGEQYEQARGASQSERMSEQRELDEQRVTPAAEPQAEPTPAPAPSPAPVQTQNAQEGMDTAKTENAQENAPAPAQSAPYNPFAVGGTVQYNGHQYEILETPNEENRNMFRLKNTDGAHGGTLSIPRSEIRRENQNLLRANDELESAPAPAAELENVREPKTEERTEEKAQNVPDLTLHSGISEEEINRNMDSIRAAADKLGIEQNSVQNEQNAVQNEQAGAQDTVQQVRQNAPVTLEQAERSMDTIRSIAGNNNFGETGAKAFREGYEIGQDSLEYFRDFSRVYNAVLSGSTRQDTGTLTTAQVRAAVDAARADRAATDAKFSGGTRNRNAGAQYGEWEHRNISSDVRKSLDRLARKLGVSVRFVDELERGGADISGNVVQISRRALESGRNPIEFLVGHEFTHRMQEIAPDAYSEVRRLAQGSADFDRWVERHLAAEPNLTRAEAVDEAVADYVGALLHDEKALRRFANAASPNVLQRFIDFLKELRFALSKKERTDAEKAIRILEKAARAAGKNAKGLSYGSETDSYDREMDAGERHSAVSLFSAISITAERDADTHLITYKDADGNAIEKVTPAMIENSGMGALIKCAVEVGSITQKQAKQQAKDLADVYNLVMQTSDSEMVWEWVGATLFSAMKRNYDTQYSTTVDFSTVCRKTVEMLEAVSSAMQELGRGLSRDEITDIQLKLIEEAKKNGQDPIVPCPVCYVFSRWAGVGGILDNIKRYQEKYPLTMQDAEIHAAIRRLQNSTKADIRNELHEHDAEYRDLEQQNELLAVSLKETRKVRDSLKRDTPERREAARNVNTLAAEKSRITKQMKAMVNDGTPELAWLQRVRMEQDGLTGNWVTRAGYADEWSGLSAKERDDILFNLMDAESFSQAAPLTWSYRTTRGPSAGKAILPYSDMRIGDIILGVKNSASGKTTFQNVSGELTKDQRKAWKNAISRARAQNLIGGQRYQSTSDFRYDYALDYLQSFFELQAIGGNIQTYTKIIEYADMIGSIGGDANVSVMPLNRGYDEDGNLIFSPVTGVPIEAARAVSERYDSVQPILVGINDEHIRLALESDYITFVIPYHASGASINDFIAKLVSNLDESFNELNYFDYSGNQTDSPAKKPTAAQARLRDLRTKLLTKPSTEILDADGNQILGKDFKPLKKKWEPSAEDIAFMRGMADSAKSIRGRSYEKLREIEKKALGGNRKAIEEYLSWSAGSLWDIYQRLWDTDYYRGVSLPSAQAKIIMPHEYWDRKSKIGNAHINGFIFRSYCFSMGITPRFTTELTKNYVDENGDKQSVKYGDLSQYPGYWKVLIDRAMYDLKGNYRDQNAINLTGFDKARLTPDYNRQGYLSELPTVQEPDSSRASRAAERFVEENRRNSAVDFADVSSGGFEYMKPFSEQLDDYEKNDGSFPQRDTFVLGASPKVFTDVGLPALPVTMNQRHVRASLYGEETSNKSNAEDHIVKKEELAKLPEKLADPIAIIQNKRPSEKKASPYKLTVIIDMVINGKRAIVPVQIGGQGTINWVNIDANLATTLHGNRDAIERLRDAIESDSSDNISVYYINNKKTTEVFKQAGNASPRPLSNLDGVIHKITDQGSPVKLRIASQTESSQFKRWYRNSDFNPDGTPVVHYDEENGYHYRNAEGQIKSATDNIGTFDGNNPNPRYATLSYSDLAEQFGDIPARTERAMYGDGVLLPNGKVAQKSATDKLARKILKRYSSHEDADSISTAMLSVLHDMWQGAGGKPVAGLHDRVMNIAEAVANNASEADTTAWNDYAGIRKYFRGTTLTISQEEARDIPDFGAFRKSLFGKVNLRIAREGDAPGTQVDAVWGELQEQFGEGMFPADITAQSDMLYHIADTLKTAYSRPETELYMDEQEFDSVRQEIAQDIISGLTEISGVSTAKALRDLAKRNDALAARVEQMLDNEEKAARAIAERDKMEQALERSESRRKKLQEAEDARKAAAAQAKEQDRADIAGILAEMNASSLYTSLVEEFGAIRPGEKPARKVVVPKRTSEDDKVSQTIRSVLESSVTTEELIPTIQKLIEDGMFSYDPYTDRQAIYDAEREIEDADGDARDFYYGWSEKINAGQVSKKLTAQGWAIYNAAATAGDTKLAIRVLTDITYHQRNAAQAVQATRILKQLSPSAQLYGVTRTVERFNEELENEHGFAANNKNRRRRVEETMDDLDRRRDDLLDRLEDMSGETESGTGSTVEDIGRAMRGGKRSGKRGTDSETQEEVEPKDWVADVADALERAMYARTKPQNAKKPTIDQTALKDLIAFADQYVARRKGDRKPRTAIDRIRDFYTYRSEYARAWNQAIAKYRQEHGEESAAMDAMEDWLNGTIAYAGQGNDKVLLSAVAQAALDGDVKLRNIVRRSAIGDRQAVENEIYARLSDAIGPAARENEQQLRGAVSRWVKEQMDSRPVDVDAMLQRDMRQAVKDAGKTIADIIRSGRKDRYALGRAIAGSLVKKYGISEYAAQDIADRIVTSWNETMAAEAQKALANRFRSRDDRQVIERSIADRLTELGNLGAFSDPQYRIKASNAILKGDYNIALNESLVDQFLAAGSETERQDILIEIYKDVGRQMPATLADKFNALRYLAMLGNARTHIRNIFGNAVFAPVVMSKNMTAMAIERMIPAEKRTKGIPTPELMRAASDDYANVRPAIMRGGKYVEKDGMNDYIDQGRRIFRNPIFEFLRVKNGEALDAEDSWFARPHYAIALAQYCAARGISAEAIRSGQGDEIQAARTYAMNEAAKATYRDTNDFSEFISNVGRYRGDNKFAQGASYLMSGILPFRKTPANIAVRAIEYSPLGVFHTVGSLIDCVRTGNTEPAQVVDQLAAMTTGTVLAATGMYLAWMGILKAADSDDDDDRNKFLKDMGRQEWAIEWGGYSVTIDWLAPECIPLLMGANFMEKFSDGGSLFQSALNAFNSIAEPFLEMSMLSSVQDTLDSVSGWDTGNASSLVTVVANAATNLLTQVVPTLAGQAERASQENRMANWSKTGSTVEIAGHEIETADVLPADWKYVIAKNSAKIPGVDYNQYEYVDVWGRAQSNGGFLARIVNNFINPAYVRKIDDDAVNAYIENLYPAGREVGVNVIPTRAAYKITVDGEDIELDKDQYHTYAVSVGQNRFSLVQTAMADKAFMALPDTEQAEIIGKLYSYADYLGKLDVLPKEQRDTLIAKTSEGSGKWLTQAQDAQKAGISPIALVMVRNTVNNVSGWHDSKGNAVSNSAGLQQMDAINKAFSSTDAREWAYDNMGDIGKTIRGYNPVKVQEELAKARKSAVDAG